MMFESNGDSGPPCGVPSSVSINVSGGGGSNGGVRGPEVGWLCAEGAGAVVPENKTLPAVAMRHVEINASVPVKIRGYDDRRRLGGQRAERWKGAFPIVEANKTWFGVVRRGTAVGNNDVRAVVAVEVGDGHVAGGPLGLAKSARDAKMAMAVVQIDELAVGPVVADHEVEMPIAVEIGQSGGVGAVGCIGEIFGVEATFAIVAEDEIDQGPMAAFGEDDVEVAIPIDVTEADASGGFTLGFQK